MDALAQLLPDPTKLLAALGTRPTSGAITVTPGIINSITTFLTFLLLMDAAAFVAYLVEMWHYGLVDVFLYYDSFTVASNILLIGLIVILAGVFGFFIIRAANERHGWFSSLWSFAAANFALFLLISEQFDMADTINTLLLDYYGYEDTIVGFINLPTYFFLVGGFILSVMALFRWKDLRRWFPAKAK